MYKLAIIGLVALLSIGCASTKTKYVTKIETVTVYKPVYTPPESLKDVKVIERPDLKSNYIVVVDKEDPGKVVKILLESMAQLRAYAEQLENQNKVLLEIHMRPADPIPPTTRTVETINN